MKVYVYKTDVRSWQYYPEIPDDRKSEFYAVITDLTNDELVSDYEFVLQDGVCTPVRKNKQAQLIAEAEKKKADTVVEATLKITPPSGCSRPRYRHGGRKGPAYRVEEIPRAA